MKSSLQLYCIDSNFFIEAWNKYYSPGLCGDYWKVLNELAKSGIFFIPSQVRDEIYKVDDDLKAWLDKSDVIVKENNEDVGKCLINIYATDTKHKFLVDNTKGRSIADPWVIAHALNDNAIVVTKEEKITDPASQKIKIPNVCDNMGVKWMNDFDFIKIMGIKFSCKIEKIKYLNAK